MRTPIRLVVFVLGLSGLGAFGAATIADSAEAAIHPIVCSQNAVAHGLADNPARSDDIGNPPGLTPHDPDDLLGIGFPHFDALMAADQNPVTFFRPLVAQGFDETRPNWNKTCGPPAP